MKKMITLFLAAFLFAASNASWANGSSIQSEKDFLAAPNPAVEKTQIIILFTPPAGSNVIILNLLGEVIQVSPVDGLSSIETGNLSQGLYIVRLQNGENVIRVFKLQISH